MFCPKCGKEVPEGSAYCPSCGAAMNTSESATNDFAANDTYSQSSGTVQKSALAAGLLGIFLGVYGVHNFYLGYTSKAVGQLILGLTIIGSPVSAIWGLVEGIMLLTGEIRTDGYGHPIKKDL
jgi:TM2 domain-containing membrane protein YozV